MTYRGRLAPSPTGDVHVGHARTYLVAWLRARQAGGALVMRIEDLDPPRVVEGAGARILADLRWLGLDWDEGPDVGGPHGPYVQSQRGDRYAAALGRLATYPCTCSRKEIRQLASAPHGVEGLGVRYPGTCRDGPRHPDRPAATRFRMPEPPPPCHDLLLGPQDTEALGGDFVLRRADGLWAYQLAVVVDDAAMGITEVVRGADLLPSTPRQLALFAALGAPAPAFLHVPLVHGPDGERLAKRHGSTSLADYRAAGWSAPALVGALAASLGLVGEARPMTPRELLGKLLGRPLLERLNREPTVAPVVGGRIDAPGGSVDAHGMNAQMFAELKEAFASHDANQDGSLDRGEFTALLKHLGTSMTEEQIEMGFRMVDEDESGRISFDELEKWWEIVRDG